MCNRQASDDSLCFQAGMEFAKCRHYGNRDAQVCRPKPAPMSSSPRAVHSC